MTRLNLHIRHILLTAISLICTPAVLAQDLREERMPADTIAADTVVVDSSIMVLPWDERTKLQLADLAKEADAAYFTTGICVYDLTADSLLFGYNHKKVMRPASTQKLVTAISALDILGAAHEYRTKAYYTGTITPDSVLQGDIYIVGDFDPLYSYADLKTLASEIMSLGIRRIDGSILGDETMKEAALYGYGWCWDDVPSTYQPFLSPLMFDRGRLAPGSTKYSTDPLFHPTIYMLSTLRSMLHVNDSLPLPVELRALPASGTHQFYGFSHTIADVLTRMMKNSDNLHAESMFYQIANFNTGRRCTTKDGVRQIENTIRKACTAMPRQAHPTDEGFSTPYTEIADGSGVSLYNYISPLTQVALLRFAYTQQRIFNHLYPALPIAGVDGTLSSRMKRGNSYGNVHAKTGTVEGVSSLAGYVTASNGHLLAFSIINNGVLKTATGKDIQDRICDTLSR